MAQTIQQVQPVIDSENSIDVWRYLAFLSENRWLIAGVALAVVLVATTYALIATPVYKANLLIKVDDNVGRLKNIPGDFSGNEVNQDIKTAVASETEVLRSRAVVSRAVDGGRFYITVTPKYFPVIGEWIARRNKAIADPGIFGYGGYVWGAEQAKVSVFNVPEELEGKNFILTAEAEGSFSLRNEENGIEISGRVGEPVSVESGGGKIELLVDHLAARPGAQFFMARMARLETIEKLQEELNISEKGKQSGIIDVSLEGANPKLISSVLNEIGREYVRQNVDRKSEEAEKTLAFLNTQLPELKQELERAEKKYNELRNNRGTVDLGEEAKTALQQSVLTQTKMVELKQKKEELLSRFQNEHPAVQAI
ncbi:MAG TPA: Wzz/FepE/Etk N-terminal domain-containing protein, partial [Noviherbaspirillum sp.]|nr:Wzz/FepE/Etk N-terminal domain-containing protein [Noviherbaspirillum sp.]